MLGVRQDMGGQEKSGVHSHLVWDRGSSYRGQGLNQKGTPRNEIPWLEGAMGL